MIKKIPFDNFLSGFKNLIFRFPLASLFILAMTGKKLYFDDFFVSDGYIHSILIFGILVSVISQMIYERFYLKESKVRLILHGGSFVLIVFYAFYMRASLSIIDDPSLFFYSIPGIRAMILYFTLSALFIWLPTIGKKEIKFSDSFIVSFRALFTSQFFSIVLLLGFSTIMLLIDNLLFSVGTKWWSDSLIVIFNFVGPMIFLSMIPKYYLIESEDEKEVQSIQSLIESSVFLNRLVSYILIPLMVIFSGILILYIVTNFGSEFFTESAIEGLLLNYIIYGWILLLLSDSVESDLVRIFKKIFPYALIFVVFLQMIATFIQIRKVGITHGRYFILLLGLASLIGAGWYLVKKEDLRIFPFLVVLTGFISLIPPIGAMSVSVRNQVNQIENLLEERDIDLNDGVVSKDQPITMDKEAQLKHSFSYLSSIKGLNKLSWLPKEYYSNPMNYFTSDIAPDLLEEYEDEEEEEEEEEEVKNESIIHLDIDSIQIDLKDYSRLIDLAAYTESLEKTGPFELDGQEYLYRLDLEDTFEIIIDSDDLEEALIFDFSYILDEFEDVSTLELGIEDLTYTEEQDGFTLEIIIHSLEIIDDSIYIHFYLLV